AWETKVPDFLVPRVRELVHKLVTGEYEDLVQSGVAEGWTPEHLAEYIKEIQDDDGAPLTDLPDAFFEEDDSTLAIEDGRYDVHVKLWTTDGPSAYTLVIEFHSSSEGHGARFDNFEVM